jgi:alpha-1,2-mannosyltransferase
VAQGFHATDAPSFAEAIRQAFSLPPAEAKRTREAARKAAVERFSQKEFERGFERHCEVLRALAVERKTKEEAEAERT